MTTKIKVTLIKSLIGTREDHRATIKGLGLGRINSSRSLADTPEIRGMVDKVSYLLRVEHTQ
ncbi:MAG: 50S ribosomal protein L30 [Burkholderiaceae bacterium]|jgi:large subunit ribosomal protein L30